MPKFHSSTHGANKGASVFVETLARLPSQHGPFCEAIEALRLPDARRSFTEAGAPSPFAKVETHSIIHLMATRVLFDSLDILPALRTLARMGVDLDAATPNNPLKTALGAGRGRLIFARALLMAGGMVDGPSSAHASPFHEALGRGDLSGAKLLIEFGADLELRDKSGRTPLHEAIQRDQPESCELILLAGADLDALDAAGITPLQAAMHRQALAPRPSKMPPRADCVPVLLREASRKERLLLDADTPDASQGGAPRASI